MDLETSLRWLFSKESQAERKVPARTLRRMNELMWGLWPPVPLVGEVYDVVHLDGIHLHRDAVVPVAIASGHAVGWYGGRERDLGRVGPSHGPHQPAAGGGGRRRGRGAQGVAHLLAGHQGAALPVPCVHERHRPDRVETQIGGGQTA